LTARILDGAAIAEAVRGEAALEVARLKAAHGVTPKLTVVLAGDDPASSIYVRNKERACREAGIAGDVLRLPSPSREELLATVRRLNQDPQVHGILVQLPLPRGIDASEVVLALDPAKDVDGLHPENAGRLLGGLPGFVPCTPAGILEILLGIWAIGYPGRSAALLILWIGVGGIIRGIGEIAMSFQVRKLPEEVLV